MSILYRDLRPVGQTGNSVYTLVGQPRELGVKDACADLIRDRQGEARRT